MHQEGTGAPTRHVETVLSGCDALVLECNHDLELLRGGAYPRWLKDRVAGDWGHLNNAQAGALLASIERSRLKHVVAAHLSGGCVGLHIEGPARRPRAHGIPSACPSPSTP